MLRSDLAIARASLLCAAAGARAFEVLNLVVVRGRRPFGLDVTDAHFWELGLKQYERFVEELEKIVS
jgi:hypothetical protein